MDHAGTFAVGVLVGLAIAVVIYTLSRYRAVRMAKALKAADPWQQWHEVEGGDTTDRLPSPAPPQGEATMGRVRYGVNRPGRSGVRGHKPR
jgi:hypothetical protein